MNEAPTKMVNKKAAHCSGFLFFDFIEILPKVAVA